MFTVCSTYANIAPDCDIYITVWSDDLCIGAMRHESDGGRQCKNKSYATSSRKRKKSYGN